MVLLGFAVLTLIPLGLVVLLIGAGTTIRIVSNDLDAPAERIAEVYKTRWQIELLFKWLKQNLKLKHFLGTSENAVRIQIYVAPIAYLLLREAHRDQTAIATLQNFTRLVRLNIMHRRPTNALIPQQNPPPEDPRQYQMKLPQCQTGQQWA